MTITEQHVNALAAEAYGMVPPLIKHMAAVSPEVAYHYLVGLTVISKSKFTDVEQQAIQLKVSLLNRCEPCIKGHSYFLKQAGVSDDDIAAIRRGLLTSMKNVNRVIDLTENIFQGGRDGFIGERLDRLESANAGKAELFQIVSLIASKTISNYTNNYLSSVKARNLVN